MSRASQRRSAHMSGKLSKTSSNPWLGSLDDDDDDGDNVVDKQFDKLLG